MRAKRARTILFEFHLFVMHSEFKNSATLCVMSIPGGGLRPGQRLGAAAPGVRASGQPPADRPMLMSPSAVMTAALRDLRGVLIESSIAVV